MLGLSAIAALPLGDARGVPYVMSVTHGTYALSLQGAGKLITDIYPSGTFTLDGRAINFDVGYAFAVDTGTFTQTGNDAAFAIGKGVVADSGTFALSVYNIETSVGLSPDAEVGVFTLTGQDIAITDLHISISPDAASFAATFQDASVTAQRPFPVDQGTFTLTVNDASVTAQRTLEIDEANYLTSYYDVKFRGFFSPYVPPEIWTEVV